MTQLTLDHMNELIFLTDFLFTEREGDVDTSSPTANTKLHAYGLMHAKGRKLGMNKNQIPTPLNPKEKL